jgi:hypothetical protein
MGAEVVIKPDAKMSFLQWVDGPLRDIITQLDEEGMTLERVAMTVVKKEEADVKDDRYTR